MVKHVSIVCSKGNICLNTFGLSQVSQETDRIYIKVRHICVCVCMFLWLTFWCFFPSPISQGENLCGDTVWRERGIERKNATEEIKKTWIAYSVRSNNETYHPLLSQCVCVCVAVRQTHMLTLSGRWNKLGLRRPRCLPDQQQDSLTASYNEQHQQQPHCAFAHADSPASHLNTAKLLLLLLQALSFSAIYLFSNVTVWFILQFIVYFRHDTQDLTVMLKKWFPFHPPWKWQMRDAAWLAVTSLLTAANTDRKSVV